MTTHLTQQMECYVFRSAKTAAEVEEVAGRYREAVKLMAEQGGDQRTMAIQISNLKAYRLWCIEQDARR